MRRHREQQRDLQSPTTAYTGPTDHRPQTTDHKTTDHRPQTTDHRPQTTDHRPQITDHRSQTTDHRSQITDHRSQTTDHRAQGTGHRPRRHSYAPVSSSDNKASHLTARAWRACSRTSCHGIGRVANVGIKRHAPRQPKVTQLHNRYHKQLVMLTISANLAMHAPSQTTNLWTQRCSQA